MIRSASPNDASAVASLLGELGYPCEAASVRVRMAHMLAVDAETAPDYVLVAGDDQTDGALGFLALHRFAALHDDAPVALITALVVTERARGLGLGRQLVDRAIDVARRWGCTRLMVTTHVRRAGAHTFYERLGFELTGRRYVKTLQAP